VGDQAEPLQTNDPIEYREGSWGFWDETWSNWHGGFTSLTETGKALNSYARWLETNSQSDYYHSLPRSERRKSQRLGWRNWYINRGRLPLEGDRRVERQLSWRRVH
jgi:hypothetical protein